MLSDGDSIRDSLRALGDEMRAAADRSSALRRDREQLVSRARAAGLTWREIGAALGVTERALIKARKASER